MFMNYGGCAINIKTVKDQLDVTGWTYRIEVDPVTGMKTVYLNDIDNTYVSQNPNLNVPTIK